MKEKTGEIFSIAKDIMSVPGCTVSKEIHAGKNTITYFSLAENTDISAEIYPYHKLILVALGGIGVYGKDGVQRKLDAGYGILTATDVPVGTCTAEGAVYTEISIQKEDIMNRAIKVGEVFKLTELIPYQYGKVANMDIVHNDKMKFVIMVFDAGTGLSEHAAPGEALIFALDGEAVIVLLALLYLAVKNIHLGPTLPGFLSPNVAKVPVDNFGILEIGTVDEDLKLFFGENA